MSIEKKSKRFDEALAIAKECITHVHDDAVRKYIFSMFPELKESEDEEIRKWIIDDIRYNMNNEPLNNSEYKKKAEKAIAWLEKQGEQKLADNVEPKFKLGEWVVWNNQYYKVNYNSCGYELVDQNGLSTSLEYGTVDKSAHVFSIKDAKDGDILCTYECNEPKIVFILKGTPKKHYALSYYCYYNIMYPHFGPDSEKGCLAPNDEDVKPATKEQRDVLIKAITDAGYTFDFKEKVLKKIENKNPLLSDFFKAEYERGKADAQKPVEWSALDERNLQGIIDEIEANKNQAPDYDIETYDRFLNWLKSLRPHKQWKPSEEQIGVIEAVINNRSFQRRYLDSLYEQLKKLKEE